MVNVKDVVEKLEARIEEQNPPLPEKKTFPELHRPENYRGQSREYLILQACRPNGAQIEQRIYHRFTKVV